MWFHFGVHLITFPILESARAYPNGRVGSGGRTLTARSGRADADADACAGAHADACADADIDVHADAHADADARADACADADAGSGGRTLTGGRAGPAGH